MTTVMLVKVEGGTVVNRILAAVPAVPEEGRPAPPTLAESFPDYVEAAEEVQIGWSYDGETFAAPAPEAAPAPTADDVKAEAYRRIVAVCPEWRQRNLTAQATILAEKGRANWTTQELAAWDAGAALWAQIAAIRAASDVIEAMDPIPADFADPSRWP